MLLGKIFLGKDNVEVMEDPVMGAEDFAYFGKHIPSFFLLCWSEWRAIRKWKYASPSKVILGWKVFNNKYENFISIGSRIFKL